MSSQRPPSSRRPAADRARGAAPGAPATVKRPASAGADAAPAPLGEREIEQIDALLGSLPPDRDALDAVMLDGFLCGVLLQPRPVPAAQWLPLITDLDGQPPPRGFDSAHLHALVRRRHDELERAITQRRWFDPWVFELDEDTSPSETVLPWVAGFAAALDAFPDLVARHEDAIVEPLATLYRHFDPEDLEDADALLAEIETLELPADLPEAVEDLVRSVLLIADVSRPQAVNRPAARPRATPAARPAARPPKPPSRGR